MTDKFCAACQLPFDWPGVNRGDEEYCCDGCAAGQACTCPQHDHRADQAREMAEVE